MLGPEDPARTCDNLRNECCDESSARTAVIHNYRMGKVLSAFVGLSVVATACSSATDSATSDINSEPAVESDAESTEESAEPGAPIEFELPVGAPIDFGPAPEVPEGDVSPEVAEALALVTSSDVDESTFTPEQLDAIAFLGESGDPRVAWTLSDILRFSRNPDRITAISIAANTLLGDSFVGSDWGDLTDRLIAWDIPEPTGYIDQKRAIFTSVLIDWEPFFDPASPIDWRFVSWGGVRIDDQPYNETPGTTCNCIPAVDNPETQSAEDATWLEDDDVIFGVVINGEARAYPRRTMEVREMVNDTLGGRDFALPYCTLCGSAQVWFTDNVDGLDERPILRTSGLLIRSNKVMYELNSGSVYDTFLGDAQSGPHLEAGIQLEQHTVVTSTWGAWVEENPGTDVLVEELALGRDFDFRSGRDAGGPIFPIGDVDPRLDIQEDVLGIIQEDGTPLAFHVNSAIAALENGETVEVDGITLELSGSGVKAVDADGNDIVGHQSFWFAWSQFNEGTELWPEV